ncbi:MAG: tetratricopeptide repeat protein [Ginsengibacter sp.]
MKTFYITIFACFLTSFSFSQNTDSSQYYFNKGVEENAAKLYSVASQNFEKAIQINPDYMEAYIANGKANLAMRRVSQATQNFEEAYKIDQGNKEVIKELSSLYFSNRQFQKAIELAQKCTGCDNADRILGMSNYNLEDYGKAEKYLKQAIALNTQDAEAAYTLGRTYLELENEKSAITFYEKAIDADTSRSAWMYELGLIYYNQNDYKNSLKYFDRAAEKGYTKSNDFYENYGFAQLYYGDTGNGLKTLNTVLERKPNNKELLNNIANAMYDTRKYEEALGYFKTLLDLNPKDATSLYMAGMTFQKLGQKEKGQKICDNAIAMDPSLAKYRQKKEMPAGL